MAFEHLVALGLGNAWAGVFNGDAITEYFDVDGALAGVLEGIADEIAQLKTLTKLDMSHNKVQGLPNVMHRMSNLMTLDMNDNPLLGVPNSVVQGGAAAIRNYLKIQSEKKVVKK